MTLTIPSATVRVCKLNVSSEAATRHHRPFLATAPFEGGKLSVRMVQPQCPGRVRTTLNATQSSQHEQSPSRHELEVQLQDAIRLEQYQRAAELRDALKCLEPAQDTAFSLKKQLEACVAEERFEVSASS